MMACLRERRLAACDGCKFKFKFVRASREDCKTICGFGAPVSGRRFRGAGFGAPVSGRRFRGAGFGALVSGRRFRKVKF